jgi:hypothetical protein
MVWALTIHAYPQSGNVTMRMHWTRYKALLKVWFWLVRTAPGFLAVSKPSGRRRVTIQLHGSRAIDKVNRYFAVKPIEDVLRPPKHETGIYKTGKKKGQPWKRDRLGHGLILEDNDPNVDLQVPPVLKLGKGESPFIVITLEDIAS